MPPGPAPCPKHRAIFALAALGAALPLARPAHAGGDNVFPNGASPPLLRAEVAGNRQIAGYDAPGVRMGGFQIAPEAVVRAEADSNVLNRQTNRRGDTAMTLATAVTATGTFGVTGLRLVGAASLARFARLAAQNHETARIEAQATAPLGANLDAGVEVGWSRQREANPALAGIDSDGPVLFDEARGALGLTVRSGASRARARVELDRRDYRPLIRAGTPIDQAFRDRQVLVASLRAEHTTRGGRSLFAEAAYRQIASLHPAACCTRSARGGQVLAGMRGELAPLISVELAAGYLWRDYRSAQYRDYHGATGRARVEWYATPLTSVALTFRRDIAEAGLPGSAGVVVDLGQIQLFHELRRNLNLIADAALSREHYRDDFVSARTARSVTAGVEGRYALSGRYLLGAFARYRNRTSSTPLLPRLGSAAECGLSLRLKL